MASSLVPLPDLSTTPEFAALRAHHTAIAGLHLRDLFRDDPGRAERYSCEGAGIFLDYSKNRITDETVALLCKLARARHLRDAINAMFSGEKINLTEDRAVLHTALRAERGANLTVDGQDVVGDVHAVLASMAVFAEKVRIGEHVGFTGRPIRAIVNIGIGGSDLGPLMA